MTRLQKIDTTSYSKLDTADHCYHLGEYTAGGGFGVSQTNQQILNLKKRVPVPIQQVRYKDGAIRFWGDALAAAIDLSVAETRFTFVPAPSSRLLGSPEYDDRMVRVLGRLKELHPALDVRELVLTTGARPPQHEGTRLSIPELQASMGINAAALVTPLKPEVLIIDDVFTQGGTFKAMKNLIAPLPGVTSVMGVFLARTVWPQIDLEAIFGVVSD